MKVKLHIRGYINFVAVLLCSASTINYLFKLSESLWNLIGLFVMGMFAYANIIYFIYFIKEVFLKDTLEEINENKKWLR